MVKVCVWKLNSGGRQTLLKPSKISFKYHMQTPLLWHLRLITVSVATWLELGLSGKPLIPPSPMNVWLMPAGYHDSKVWFFPLMEMTDDIAPSKSWLPFRSLHVALIEADGKCMEVRPQHPPCFTRESQQNSRAQLSGNEAPLQDDCAIAWRAIVNKCSSCHICFFLTNSVLTTTGDQTAPWTSTAPNRTSRLALRITGNQGCEQSINIPEPHPCRSPGKWFLWALWRSSRLCRSSGYRSRPRAGSGGNTSSWRTEAESRNGICRKK